MLPRTRFVVVGIRCCLLCNPPYVEARDAAVEEEQAVSCLKQIIEYRFKFKRKDKMGVQ